MKPAKIILMLAALAGSSINAVAVSASFSNTSGPSPTITSTSGNVVASGYVVLGGNQWYDSNAPFFVQVEQTGNGVGVSSFVGTPGQTGGLVEGTFSEHLLLDFSGTGTGSVTIDSLVLWFTNPVSSPYFNYQWISAPPSGTTPTLGFSTNVSTGIIVGSNTYSGITGSGRYLLLGGIPIGQGNTGSNEFAVTAVNYTSVPDGASTLALMGAAVATLGFAARRRRA